MPGFASIVNSMLRLLTDDSATDLYKSALKLSPQSENYFDPAVRDAALADSIRGWHTRLAVEALRGWNWPYWINAQINPASAAFCATTHQATLTNVVSRDMAVIPGIPARFAGTMDRRGMITPIGSRFSMEIWFRLGNEIIIPAQILNEDKIRFFTGPDNIVFQLEMEHEIVSVTAAAHQVDDFEFLRITAATTPNGPDHHRPTAIYFSVRPYNLESVTPLHDLVYNSKGFWMSENHIVGWFGTRPDVSWASDALHGDSALFLSAPPERTAVRCAAGMATATSAFHFPDPAEHAPSADIIVPLIPAYPREFPFPNLIATGSTRSLKTPPAAQSQPVTASSAAVTASHLQLACATDVTSPEVQNSLLHRNSFLVAAVRAFLYMGDRRRAGRILSYCALGIHKNGYLPAGRGNWSFQGQFLSALADYYRIPGLEIDETILRYTQIKSAARWIMRKRCEISYAPNKPKGLLPPGITRDGIGTEYQLADNIWAVEGLEAAKEMARLFNAPTDAQAFHNDAVKYASQINTAIHRELEYGVTQQVPGRLQHAFDASSAVELLDIALTDEARSLLKPEDWLSRLMDKLAEPMPGVAELGNGTRLLRMDERGLRPARRILLQLAHHLTYEKWRPDVDELEKLLTPMNAWTEMIHPSTFSGCGRLLVDPEAAALYLILMHRREKLDKTVNNRGI